MNHASLFSDIGGFDLAAEWMGWTNVFHCEINSFAQKILKYYWPKAIAYDDITKTDFTIWRNRIDILTGGFPCQPYSQAGKRLGKNDERHLWPSMLRAIREIQPTWVVGENVRGLTNWNGGLVFNEVQTDLEAVGYEVQPFLLPAAGVGAPHERYRIWFVAYANLYGHQLRRNKQNRSAQSESKSEGDQRQWLWDDNRGIGKQKSTTDARGEQLQVRPQTRNFKDSEENNTKMDNRVERSSYIRDAPYTGCSERQNWLHGKEPGRETTKFGDSYTKYGRFSQFPTVEPTIRRRNDGLPSRLAGITFSKHRNESIKAYGNAIVPQVALQIFKAIQQYENAQALNPKP